MVGVTVTSVSVIYHKPRDRKAWWNSLLHYPTCIQTTPDNRRPFRRCGTVRDIRLWLEGVQEPINPPSNWDGTVFLHCCFGNQISPFFVLESSMHQKGLICLLLRTYILKQGISFRGSTLDPAGGSAPDICLHPTTCLPSPWAQPPQSKFYDYIALWQGAHKIDSSVQITQEAVRELETVGEETATHIREYSNGNL